MEHQEAREGARRSAGAGARFLPVAVVPDRSLAVDGPEGAIEVLLAGGRRVRVGHGFDAATLLRLVRALESLPC